MSANHEGGIALTCDANGAILEIIRDDFGIAHEPTRGTPLTALASADGAAKVLAFLEAVRQEQAAFDWELTVPVGGQPTPLHFTGGRVGNGKLFILGAPTRAGIDRLYDELLGISNEHATLVRALMQDHARLGRAEDERDSTRYDELTRLNNDLATAHRELAKTTAELSRLNEEKNQFLGMAAHDLRNPLGAVTTYSELLLEEAGPTLTPEQVEFVTTIKSLSTFMLRLVNDLLDVSKIEAGKLDLELEDADLAALVQRNLKLNMSLAQRKAIRIVFATGPEPVNVSVDPGKIEQVLTNLVTNAVKFSQPGTTVTVRLWPDNGEARLSVGDQGPGIPAAEVEKLFRPFQRTSVKSTGGESSTGLGLAIVRKIVEGHRGRIWVESTVGRGSTFHVALPIA